jgi:Ca2+-binding EF-hand superfamily protein
MVQANNAVAVLDKMRAQLNARGAKTVRGLGRTFRHFDSVDGNRKCDANEFFTGLQDIGVHVSKAECECLIKLLDTDGDGCINFDEFLIGVRGSLNEKRQAMVDKAFLKFDNDGSGCIEAGDLKGVYTANMHPKVISGEMTEDEVFLEFLANFGDKNGDGKVDRKEWNDYYAAVSSSIDNDDHFVQLMKAAWKI